MSKAQAPSPAVQALVSDRSGGVCEYCGKHAAVDQDHRKARGNGGSRIPWVNQAANLIDTCRECHTYKEANPNEARERGWKISGDLDYADTVPFEDLNGHRWLLDNDGNKFLLEANYAN